jgi:hypothetical protein
MTHPVPHLGDIIINANSIYGDGVNVAARLEALAEPRPRSRTTPKAPAPALS